MIELSIVLIVAALVWLLYEVKVAPPVEDELDELLDHLYKEDK